MDSTLIPMIRKVMPELLARDIAGVQPMTDDCGEVFKLRYIEGYRKHDRFGTIIHSFIEGWMIHDGKEFIPDSMFVELYPDLHYEELANVSNRKRIA